MNILFVSPFFPYEKVGHAGGKFVYEIIRALSINHNIHLLSRIEEPELEHLPEMELLCKKVTLRKVTAASLDIFSIFNKILSYYRLAKDAELLARNNSFDIIQVEFVEAGIFLRPEKNGSAYIIDAHDVISKPYKRRYQQSRSLLEKVILYFLYRFVHLIEAYTVEKFDMVHTKSGQDRSILLKQMNPNLDIEVIPCAAALDAEIDSSKKEAFSILFLGAMNRDANLRAVKYFHENIFPVIVDSIPDIRWYIVGSKPDAEIAALAEDKRIIVTGFVEDTAEYYNRASVFVSPIIIGGGIIVKNLDAMAMMCPLVTTSVGNEGIEAIHERDLFVEDDPASFAKRVVILLTNEPLRNKTAENGRRFVLENFHIDSISRKVEQTYKKLVDA